MRRFVVLLALAFAGCSAPWDDGGIGDALDDAAERARAGDEPAVVDLGEAADFAWDRVHVLGPYPDRAEAERRLGFRWPEANDELPSFGERVSTLVSTEGEEVVRVVSYMSREGRTYLLCVEGDDDGFGRSEAVFRALLVEGDALLISAEGERSDHLAECGF
jgi:hypothetical protein